MPIGFEDLRTGHLLGSPIAVRSSTEWGAIARAQRKHFGTVRGWAVGTQAAIVNRYGKTIRVSADELQKLAVR